MPANGWRNEAQQKGQGSLKGGRWAVFRPAADSFVFNNMGKPRPNDVLLRPFAQRIIHRPILRAEFFPASCRDPVNNTPRAKCAVAVPGFPRARPTADIAPAILASTSPSNGRQGIQKKLDKLFDKTRPSRKTEYARPAADRCPRLKNLKQLSWGGARRKAAPA